METVKVGVIGCGYWGPNLIRNFYELSDSEVTVVADLREERLRHIRSCYPPVQTTQDYHELFNLNLDAAVVATPPVTHFQFSKECLDQGLHVMVEKPMTLSSSEAEEMVHLASYRERILMVGHTFEYNPAVLALKEIIASGELGEIYTIDSARLNLGLYHKDLNVLWDLAPHDISILMFLLDALPIEVNAQGKDFVFKGIYDKVYLNLTFPGGILAHIHVSWLDPDKVRRLTVVGSKKMAVYDDIQPLEKIRIYDKGVNILPYTNSYGDFHCSYRYGDILIPNIRMDEPLRKECQHFINCIRDHSEPCSSGVDGWRVVKVLESAQESLENGSGKATISWN